MNTYLINDVFFDTDCLSSFLWVEREDIFLNILKGKIYIPNYVYIELSYVRRLKNRIDELISKNKVSIYYIEDNSLESELFIELTEKPKEFSFIIGKGEASAIALARYNNGIIASNNLKDIKKYVELYNLKHITTPDILLKAFEIGEITKEEANDIWKQMIDKRRMLPYKSFSEYLENLKNK